MTSTNNSITRKSVVQKIEANSYSKPFLSTGAKVGITLLVIATLVSLGIIIAAATNNFALLASNNIAFAIMAAATGVVATLQLTVYICLGIIYWNDTKKLEDLKKKRIIEDVDDVDENPPNDEKSAKSKSSDSESSSSVDSTESPDSEEDVKNEELMTAARWQAKLKNAKNHLDASTALYNLDTGGPLAKTTWGTPALPVLGSRQKGKAVIKSENVALAVKLPNSQLEAFPSTIQKQIAEEKKKNNNLKLECYFMVFRNSEGGRVKTLFMHPAVFQDIDPGKPESIKGKKGIFRDPVPQGGIKAERVSIGFCNGKGLKKFDGSGKQFDQNNDNHDEEKFKYTSNSETTRLLNKGKRHFDAMGRRSNGQWEDNQLQIKPGAAIGDLPSFSSETAEISTEDDAPVASFSMAAFYRGKAVAIHAIVLNDPVKSDGKKLADALTKPNPAEFVASLTNDNFVYRQDVERLLVPQFEEVEEDLEIKFLDALFQEDLQGIFKLIVNQLDSKNQNASAELIVEQYEAMRREKGEAGFQLGPKAKQILVNSLVKQFKNSKPSPNKNGVILSNGKKLKIFSTVGDGTCGLHALLGESKDGGSYRTNAKEARKQFCNWLRAQHRDNNLPAQIDNVLYDYFLHFNLAPDGFKTQAVIDKHAEYSVGYSALSKVDQDAKKDAFVKDPVVFEAYLNHLKKTHVYLLQDELAAAACCFDRELVLYQPGWGTDAKVGEKVINPGAKKGKVAVWYNGFNHYERAEVVI